MKGYMIHQFKHPIGVGVSFIAAIILVTVIFTYWSRSAFQYKVPIGTTAEAVLQGCGHPVKSLAVGDWLDPWGSGPGRNVKHETWIYPLFPRFSNRAVISFEKGRVSVIEFQWN